MNGFVIISKFSDGAYIVVYKVKRLADWNISYKIDQEKKKQKR